MLFATVTASSGNARGCSSEKKSFSLFSIMTFTQVGMLVRVEEKISRFRMHNLLSSATERLRKGVLDEKW